MRFVTCLSALLIVLFSTLHAFAINPKYQSMELKLSGLISDPNTCERAFTHFARYCGKFMNLDPRLLLGREPWSKSRGLRYAWFDFDDDGELDLYVRVETFGSCGSAGCSNIIIFHDIATSEIGHEYNGTNIVTSFAPITVHISQQNQKEQVSLKYKHGIGLFHPLEKKVLHLKYLKNRLDKEQLDLKEAKRQKLMRQKFSKEELKQEVWEKKFKEHLKDYLKNSYSK